MKKRGKTNIGKTLDRRRVNNSCKRLGADVRMALLRNSLELNPEPTI